MAGEKRVALVKVTSCMREGGPCPARFGSAYSGCSHLSASPATSRRTTIHAESRHRVNRIQTGACSPLMICFKHSATRWNLFSAISTKWIESAVRRQHHAGRLICPARVTPPSHPYAYWHGNVFAKSRVGVRDAEDSNVVLRLPLDSAVFCLFRDHRYPTRSYPPPPSRSAFYHFVLFRSLSSPPSCRLALPLPRFGLLHLQ